MIFSSWTCVFGRTCTSLGPIGPPDGPVGPIIPLLLLLSFLLIKDLFYKTYK